MKLSAPIYRLKRQAKLLSREAHLPLHAALDRIAVDEGFASWSLLAAQYASESPARTLYPRLEPGDLLLIAARPGLGKTLFALELAIEALRAGRSSVVFSLEYTEADSLRRLAELDADPVAVKERFRFDGSNRICADYIVSQLVEAPRDTFVVIDYLQLLDQRRDTPELQEQVHALKQCAVEQGLIMAVISQVHHSYDPGEKPFPGLEDIRLPNPLDLSVFDKSCFLNGSEVRFMSVR